MPIETNQSWWVEIEGIKERITFGEADGEFFREDFDSIAQIPESIADSCDPITAELNLSAFSFTVNANDSMVRLFLYQQFRNPSEVFSEISAGDSSINIDPALSLSAEDVLFIGGETFRVISTIGTSPQTVTVARNQYGTLAEKHPTGSPVYNRVPRWRGRRIEVYTRDLTIGETRRLRWTGYIDTIKRPSDGTKISITARSVWSAAIETTSNREAIDASSYRLTAYDTSDNPRRPLLRGGGVLSKPVPVLTEDNPEPVFYTQIDDALIACRVVEEYPDEFYIEADSRPLLGSELDEEYQTGERFNVEMRPLFVVSPLADEEWKTDRELSGLPIQTVSGEPVTPSTLSPWMTQFHDHPFLIALFLLTGGIINSSGGVEYTDFADRFTLNFRQLFTNAFGTRLRNLIFSTPELKVDHFILGWDSSEFDVIREVSEKLLRPFGAFFGVTQEGVPDVRLFAAMSVSDIEQVEASGRVLTAIPGPWLGDINPALENSVDVVSAKVGGLPWNEPRSLAVESIGGGSGRSRIGDAGRWDLDYSTIARFRAFDVVEDLIRKSTLSAFSFPRLRFRCPDSENANLYDLGAAVRVDTLPVDGGYLLNSAGELVEFLDQDIDTQLQFYGILIGRSFSPASRVYEVEIMLTSWRTAPIRFRGPAGVIASYDSGNDYFLLEPSPFSSLDENDVSAFAEFFDESMTVLLEMHGTDLLPSGDVFTVSEFLPAVGSGGAIRTVETPTVSYDGDIIRLAAYTSGYEFPETGLVIYNFLADDDDQLTGGDNAHEYA